MTYADFVETFETREKSQSVRIPVMRRRHAHLIGEHTAEVIAVIVSAPTGNNVERPELAADYRLEAWTEGAWKLLHRETSNRKRKKLHRFDPVHTERLRVVIERTNGCPRAELLEIRAYS